MAKIKAIVFDMDGVLIDAKEWHYEALNQALALFGFNISRAEHLDRYDGLPTREKLEMCSREKGFPRGLHCLVNHLKQLYTVECIAVKCKPTPCHCDALSRLSSEGYRIALASNSIQATIDMMLDKADIAQYMEFTLSNQDVTRCKPDPEIYEKAITRLRLQPDEVLIVEDNAHGIAAAIASGAHLLKVETVNDVTYENIRKSIDEAERQTVNIGQ